MQAYFSEPLYSPQIDRLLAKLDFDEKELILDELIGAYNGGKGELLTRLVNELVPVGIERGDRSGKWAAIRRAFYNDTE